jgi:hypothetical protein
VTAAAAPLLLCVCVCRVAGTIIQGAGGDAKVLAADICAGKVRRQPAFAQQQHQQHVMLLMQPPHEAKQKQAAQHMSLWFVPNRVVGGGYLAGAVMLLSLCGMQGLY